MSEFVKQRKLELLPIGVVFSILLNGCASAYNPQSEVEGILRATPERPKIGQAREKLRDLPEPSDRITAAVYGFGDLTGQNKPSPASGLSTAVTQGASSSLVDLMLESGWFRPVERVGLQSVLSERNLWEQRLRAQQRGALEPLPPASILFEGGIVAYEFNTRTGGLGAKILGIGGSKQYREDVLTVSLRAVNAQSGIVLSSVTSTKRIYSQTINAGLFGFVDTDIIAEAEGGWASNESVQAGLEEAIAFALIDLIAEGLTEGTWRLSDPETIRSDVFARFLSEKDVTEYISRNVVENTSKPEQEGRIERPEPSLEPSAEPSPEGGDNVIPEAVSTETAPESNVSAASIDTSSTENSVQDSVSWAETPGINGGAEETQAPARVIPEPVEASPEVSAISAQRAGDPNENISESTVQAVTLPTESEFQPEAKTASLPSNAEAPAPQSTASVEPAAPQDVSKGSVQFIVVGYSADPSPMIEFQRWLNDRYNGVDVAVIRSSDRTAYQVAIGPFEDVSDIGLVGADLQSQGIPIVEALESIGESRLVNEVGLNQ